MTFLNTLIIDENRNSRIIHELGWEVLQSQGHTIIDVKDTSVDSLKNELAEVSGIVLRTHKCPMKSLMPVLIFKLLVVMV